MPKMEDWYLDPGCGGRTSTGTKPPNVYINTPWQIIRSPSHHVASQQPHCSTTPKIGKHQQYSKTASRSIACKLQQTTCPPTSTVHLRRWFNLATVGRTWPPILLHGNTNPSISPDTSTDLGSPSHPYSMDASWPYHYTTPTDRWPFSQHDNGQHLALTNSHLAFVPLLLISANGQCIPHRIQYTNIQKMTNLWNNKSVPWGPPPTSPERRYATDGLDPPCLHWAPHHHRREQSPPTLDPTIHWAILQQHAIPSIVELRNNILNEIQDITVQWEDLTHWFRSLPSHCQQAYQQPKMIAQIRELHHLLQAINYPHADMLYTKSWPEDSLWSVPYNLDLTGKSVLIPSTPNTSLIPNLRHSTENTFSRSSTRTA